MNRPSHWPRKPFALFVRRLDHAADLINPFLIVIAIGLAILDVTCLIGLLDVGSLAARPGSGDAMSAPATSTVVNQTPY
jgi:hypothetical protein